VKIPYTVQPDKYGSHIYMAQLKVHLALPTPNAPRTKRFEAVIDSGRESVYVPRRHRTASRPRHQIWRSRNYSRNWRIYRLMGSSGGIIFTRRSDNHSRVVQGRTACGRLAWNEWIFRKLSRYVYSASFDVRDRTHRPQSSLVESCGKHLTHYSNPSWLCISWFWCKNRRQDSARRRSGGAHERHTSP
jgi:hypothetical protein